MNLPRPFCAICADDGGPLHREWGDGGAKIWICTACATEHPRSGRYAFTGSGSPTRGPGGTLPVDGNRGSGRPVGR